MHGIRVQLLTSAPAVPESAAHYRARPLSDPGKDPSNGLGIVPLAMFAISTALSAASSGAALMIQRNRATGAQKVGATNIVNDVERKMQENLQAWQSSNKYASEQKIALDTYDALWDYLTSPDGCGNAALGQAGQLCISERSPEGKWPYKTYYRDPIANDPDVKPDPVMAGSESQSGSGIEELLSRPSVAGIPLGAMLAGVLAVAGVILGMERK